MPHWLVYLMQALLILATLVFSAIVATKAGRNPWYALLMLFLYVQVPVIWALALLEWRNKPNNP